MIIQGYKNAHLSLMKDTTFSAGHNQREMGLGEELPDEATPTHLLHKISSLSARGVIQLIIARRGTKPMEILLQTQKRSQKKSPRILLMGKISRDAMRPNTLDLINRFVYTYH